MTFAASSRVQSPSSTRRSSGYSASARITSAETGRLLWTAKASSPPSGDVNGQLAELARTVMAAAGKAGLF